MGGSSVGSPPGLPANAWLWIPAATQSCSSCLSGSLWFFFPRFSNLFCLRFELELPCGLLASRWFVSREDGHCSFRIGIHSDQTCHIICFIVRRKCVTCRSYLRLGLPTLGVQILYLCVFALVALMAGFGDGILNQWSRLGPASS